MGDDEAGEAYFKDRKVQVFVRVDGLCDWRRLALSNGQVVATSGGQGYADASYAREAASRENPGIPIEDLTTEL